MKCKDCKYYKKGECKHPSLNVGGLHRASDSGCDVLLISKGRGFERR